MIRFAVPMLLLIGLPLVAVIAYRLRRLPSDHSGLRRWMIRITMLLAALSAAFALAGMELGTAIDRVAVVFLLDRSRSVDDGRAEERNVAAMRDSIATMETDDKAGLVVFGAQAVTEILPSPSPPIGPTRASVPRDATDISGAIRRGLADLPAEHAGRIALITDGLETDGDALAAAESAASRGVVIDVLPIDRAPSPEVAIESVRVPRRADPEQPIEIRIVTRASYATDVRIRVTRNGETIAEAETRIAGGQDVLVMQDVGPEAGIHRYDVHIEPLVDGQDGSRANNSGGGFLRVSGRSRALVLSNEPSESTALADAIQRTGLEVVTGGPEMIPVDLPTLAAYDLLVLNDLEARFFTEDQLRNVASYVENLGGGLLMVGARDSFGLGGYAYTPVEEVLPATFDLRQRRDRASLAMIIAIDNSGSMSVEVSPGRTKLDLANEAASRSAELLSPFDRVGVMHVDTGVTWTLRMTSVDDPATIAAAIRRGPQGGGGILVDVALRESYAALRAEQTQLKHLLLFSDGSDSENMAGMRAVVEDALRDNITTSVVSMGRGPDTPELEVLSRLGEGRFYIVEDMTSLPRIFTQETIEASRSAIVEEPISPSLGAPSPATEGIDFANAPALAGYVVMNARPRATRLLDAKDGDPLLLEWQKGVGRSATFACDAGSELAQPWLAWPGYARLFGQLARHLARAPERTDARVSVSIENGVGRVRVEAIDDEGRYRNYLDLRGSVAGPGGESLDVNLSQTGAGRYEGTFDATAPGPYLVTVRDAESGLVGSAGAVRPAGNELRGEGTDRALLGQIAAVTGGKVRTDLAGVFTERPPPAYAYEPLWPLLTIASILLLLASVALRRLVISTRWLERFMPSRARRAPRRPQPEQTLDALTAVKERRKDRPLAPEVARAREAKGEPRAGKAPSKPREAETEVEAPPEAPPPEQPPATLAEQLLATKKKKR